jgi:hypothetical protein
VIGSVAGIAQGLFEFVIGTGGNIAGGGLCATGVGCAVGAPTIAGSIALQVHGATTAVAGAKNLGKVLSEIYSVVFASSSASGAGNNPGSSGTGSSGGSSNLTSVPTIKNSEFARWFNSLTPDEFDQVWANRQLREAIQARLRSPGGMHEWHLVSRANIFKRWGVTAEQISELRTATSRVRFVNPSGRHGDIGSTIAHNELLNIIDTSTNYGTFKRRLQNWANYRLQGGVNSLLQGLRP